MRGGLVVSVQANVSGRGSGDVTNDAMAETQRLGLEVAQHAGPEARTAPVGVDPHPLDLGDTVKRAHSPAGHWIAIAEGHDERPTRRAEVTFTLSAICRNRGPPREHSVRCPGSHAVS